jgi:hypothetical protein
MQSDAGFGGEERRWTTALPSAQGYYPSSTCLMVCAISFFVSGFMTNALIPACFASSAPMRWLKPNRRHPVRHPEIHKDDL